MILRLSCEVIMDATPSELEKQTDYSYLHKLKLRKKREKTIKKYKSERENRDGEKHGKRERGDLGVVCSVVFTQGYLGMIACNLLSKHDSFFAKGIPNLRRFLLPR